jgi:2-phosphosulfolactate phosphatase
MKIHFYSLDEAEHARGLVVAVDVVRAFTTAAYAFGAGACQILEAGTVEEALALRERFPGALLMGESGGLPVDGFDLWNSPQQVSRLNLTGRTLIQRTSSGVQGIVRAISAGRLFAASFAVAGATARAIQAAQPAEVTFIVTGELLAEGSSAAEDRACAAYIAALLQGGRPQAREYMDWVDAFIKDRLSSKPGEFRRKFAADLELCALTDQFSFALEVERREGLLVMEKKG